MNAFFLWGGIATLLLLWDLSRRLPLQNLVVIVAVLLGGEGLLEWFLGGSGPTVLLWVAALLGARKFAQMILRPWRRTGWYGIWLIALAALMSALAQMSWHASLKAVALRLVTSGVLFVALAPWFIQKRPVTVSAAARE